MSNTNTVAKKTSTEDIVKALRKDYVVRNVGLPLELLNSGKVREVYVADPDRLCIVSTDRISTFDYVHPRGIPGKGIVLNQMSRHFFDLTSFIMPNHIITEDLSILGKGLEEMLILIGRSVIVTKTRPFKAECIVRGYLTGSGYKDYVRTGKVSGVSLPPGLKDGSKLPEPIFTPSTKADEGHDLNISFEDFVSIIGSRKTADALKEASLAIFWEASDYAADRGIIIADTKLEFGRTRDGKILVIDEMLTPDSSRFWPLSTYGSKLRAGEPQPSYDKQYVRDHVQNIGWNKSPPAPELPPEVVANTRTKYFEAYSRLTGIDLSSV